MKRLTSILFIIIIIISLSPTAVTATPPASDSVDDWILSDNGSNIYVKMIQYPKISISGAESGDEIGLQEIAFETDLSLSQKYLQSFKSGGIIPELALNVLNPQDRSIFKITLENCTVSGYEVKDLFTSWASTPVKAVIKLSVERITSESVIPSGPAIQTVNSKILNSAKIFLNGIECTRYISFSGIDGSLIRIGSPIYKESELLIDYSVIGTLPDWLASFDGNMGYTANPQCKLRYELSDMHGADKLAFEIQLNAIGQEFAEKEGIRKILCKYPCRVLDFSFVTDTAAVDPPPVIPARIVITDSSLRRAQEYNWSGSWVTTFGKMSLRQNGAAVTGEYGNPVETLEGTVSGNKLTGTWKDSLSSGKFEFTMSADGKSFSGTMYNQVIGGRGTFEWNGDREQ